jgi:hypothetical protein
VSFFFTFPHGLFTASNHRKNLITPEAIEILETNETELSAVDAAFAPYIRRSTLDAGCIVGIKAFASPIYEGKGKTGHLK